MHEVSSTVSPPPPIFILGLPRSGTTLLNSLLNQHSRIALMKECHLFMFCPLAFRVRREASMWRRLNLYNQTLDFHDLDPRQGRSRRIPRSQSLHRLYRDYAAANAAQIGGEKAPAYHRKAWDLRRDFPDASMIAILRSLEEIIPSYHRMARHFSSFRKPGRLAGLIVDQEQLFRFLAADTSRNRTHWITYDRLVADPEATMLALSQFLQLSFEPSMCRPPTADTLARNKTHLKWGNVLPEDIQRQHHNDQPPLPAALARKLQRYQNRWRRLFPEITAAVYSQSDHDEEPPWAELLADRIGAALHKLQESAVTDAFSWMPEFSLQYYRRLRQL